MKKKEQLQLGIKQAERIKVKWISNGSKFQQNKTFYFFYRRINKGKKIKDKLNEWDVKLSSTENE